MVVFERPIGSRKPGLQALIGERDPAGLSGKGRTAIYAEVNRPFEGRNGKEWGLNVLDTR